MARKLNKNLVGILTLLGMVILAAIGFVLLSRLPGQDPAVYAAEARAARDAEEWEKAVQTFLRAYQKDPVSNPEYLVEAARCALEGGEVASARDLVRQARVRDSRLESAVVFSTELEYEIADLLPSSVQWNRVLDEAKNLSDIAPESALAHRAMGRAYLGLRREDPTYEQKGMDALKKALELDPTDVDAVSELAEYSWRQARREQQTGAALEAEKLRDEVDAIIAASLASAEAAEDTSAISELKQLQAASLIQQGRIREGVRALEAQVEVETERPDVHLLLGAFYAGLAPSEIEEDLDRAERILKKALEIDPQSAPAYRSLGLVYKKRSVVKDDPAERKKWDDRERALYEEALVNIPYSKDFRSFRDNRFRVFFMQQIFMHHLAEASAAEDETEKGAALAQMESMIAKMKEELNPASVEVRFLTAHLLNARGDQIGAIREAEAANRIVGADALPDLRNLLASLYMTTKQWGAAREVLEEAVQFNPVEPLYRLWLGQVYVQLNDPAEAIKHLRPSAPRDLREFMINNDRAKRMLMEAYRQQGQYGKAAEVSESLGTDTTEDKFRMAQLLILEEKYLEAENALNEIMEQEPNNEAAVRGLVAVYRETGRVPLAQSLLKKLREQFPDNRRFGQLEILVSTEPGSDARDEALVKFYESEPDAFRRNLSLGEYYLAKREYDKAKRFLKEAASLKPENEIVIERLFATGMQSEDWDLATRQAVKYAELNIDGSEGKIAQGRLALARDDISRGIELIQAGLEIYPSYSMGWTFLAEGYLYADRIEDAKRVLRRAVEIDPTNGIANRMLARIAAREGNQQALERYVRLAAESLPSDVWINRQLQQIKERENPREGIRVREQIRADDSEDLENLVLLARLYATPEVADYERAADVYREALRVSGNDLGLAREIAVFFGREEVNRPAEGEELLTTLLRSEEDQETKAKVAVALGNFYEVQNVLATADRYYRMAVSLDAAPEVLVAAAEFYSRTNRPRDALEYFDRALAKMEPDEAARKDIRKRIIALLLAFVDLERAKREIDGFVSDYPDDPDGMIYEGAYHRIGGDIQEARRAFDARLERESDNVTALWQRGQLYMLMGRWQLAVEDLKRAKTFAPEGFNYQHRISLAEALMQVGQDGAAIAELKQILDASPDQENVAEALVDVYTRIDPPQYENAENIIYTFMQKNPRDWRWPALLGRAGRDAGRWARAIDGYENAAELSQFRPQVLNDLFATYKEADRPQQVIRYAGETLSGELLDRMPRVLTVLGWAYAKTGATQRSFETFDRALSAATGDFVDYSQAIAEMVTVLGKEAVLDRVQAQAKADPGNIDIRKTSVYLLEMNGKYEEAIAASDKIIEAGATGQDLVFAHLVKGMLQSRLGRYEAAKANYEQVLKLEPEQPTALNNMAFLLAEQMNNPAEALPYARAAKKLDPANPNVLDTLGWILYLNGDVGEAAGMLLRALEVDPKNHVAMFHVGLVHERRGELDEAKYRLETARSLAEQKGEKVYLPKILEALDRVREHAS